MWGRVERPGGVGRARVQERRKRRRCEREQGGAPRRREGAPRGGPRAWAPSWASSAAAAAWRPPAASMPRAAAGAAWRARARACWPWLLRGRRNARGDPPSLYAQSPRRGSAVSPCFSPPRQRGAARPARSDAAGLAEVPRDLSADLPLDCGDAELLRASSRVRGRKTRSPVPASKRFRRLEVGAHTSSIYSRVAEQHGPAAVRIASPQRASEKESDHNSCSASSAMAEGIPIARQEEPPPSVVTMGGYGGGDSSSPPSVGALEAPTPRVGSSDAPAGETTATGEGATGEAAGGFVNEGALVAQGKCPLV